MRHDNGEGTRDEISVKCVILSHQIYWTLTDGLREGI